MKLETGIAIFGGLCGLIGMGISLICVACVVGFTRSTHKIQYVPLQNDGENAVEEVAKTALTEEEKSLKDEMNKVGKKRSEIFPDVSKEIISEAEQDFDEVSQTQFLN